MVLHGVPGQKHGQDGGTGEHSANPSAGFRPASGAQRQVRTLRRNADHNLLLTLESSILLPASLSTFVLISQVRMILDSLVPTEPPRSMAKCSRTRI